MDRVCLPQHGCISDIWILSAGLAFIAVLGLYSWWRRSVPGAKPLALACLLGFLWMFGVLAQVEANEVAAKIAWYKFQVLWYVPAATATTWFSLEFAGYGRLLTRRNSLLFALPPLLALLVIITNDLHGLWWLGFVMGDVVRPVHGIGAWILTGYGWTLIFANIVVLLQLFFRSYQHRRPLALIISGQLAGRALFVMYLVNLNLLVTPYYLVLVIMVPITMYGAALFAFHIFDPLPRARRTAIEQMREGMIVFDRSLQLLSVNPAAEKILGQPAAQLRGKTWQQILVSPTDGMKVGHQIPVASVRSSPEKSQARLPNEVMLGQATDPRWYELDLSPLKDQHGSVVGWLLLLHDITARRRAQAQRLKEQQMLAVIGERERLARELHDNLGQVFAFVGTQGQTARLLLARGDVEAADAHMARLVEVAREADTDIRESILGLRTRLVEQGISSALSSYLDGYRQRHGIHIRLNAPPELADCAMDPLVEIQLLRIIQEALTNVRKHARASSVCIDFTLQNSHALVSLQDDGCGFDLPTVRGNSVGRFGLRVMQERAEEVGGTVELDSKPGQGTKVMVKVPLVPPYESDTDRQGDRHAYIVG